MKAIVRDRYGPPEALHLDSVRQPVPGDGDILVHVHAASVSAGDWHLLRGEPFIVRLAFGGLVRPKLKVLGADVAGRIESVGANVRRFRVGDEVFGHLSACGFGGFAEYVSAPETAFVAKPASITFEAAAAVPGSALAALQGLRDKGRLRPGQHVLVNGAAGGVGSFAVQIAKALDAEVTGVCSTNSVGVVRDLGADHVIDYQREDYTRGHTYDLILDTAAHRPVHHQRRALRPDGTYVMVGGAARHILGVMLLGPWVSVTSRQKLEFLSTKPVHADLLVLKELLETGRIRPLIDRRYPLRDVPQAVRYFEDGHPRGKVVIAVETRAGSGAGA